MARTRIRLSIAAAALALCAARCKTQPPAEQHSPKAQIVSAQARWDMVDFLRQDLEAERHPADGGGRAWIDREASSASPVAVQTAGRWTIDYEAGPLGVAEGGMIFFLPSPFWGWSPAQSSAPFAPGYTEVSTEAKGVRLEIEGGDQPMLAVRIAGRHLKAGERVRIAYGAGDAGARADRFAESESRFWIAVDGDGDGVRAFVEDSPFVAVVAAPPAMLLLTLPTVVRPGEPVRLTVAVVDRLGNAGYPVEGRVIFTDVPAGLDLEPQLELRAEERGRTSVAVTPRTEGVYRLRASGPGTLSAESNPMVVTATGPRVRWGDLHGHSSYSDGTATPVEYFEYARDVAALDVVALTDHDHWGTLALDTHASIWGDIQEQTKRFHVPGSFVTLLGYEWTSWIHGHRHVLYFEDEGPIFSSVDPAYESPQQLWEALRGRDAITVAHHSAGGPIATNWSIPPDPRFEPVTEVTSVHGVSEAPDSPSSIYNPVPGNFVRDALNRGYKLGFIGSGDSHDGHPGLPQIAGPCGGLAAIITDDLTRAGVLEALRQRRVYATNGPRILLRVTLDGFPMGATVTTGDAPNPARAEGPRVSNEEGEAPLADGQGGEGFLFARVVAPAPVEQVDLIRSGEVVESLTGIGLRDFALERTLSPLRAGEYLYLRVVQEDGGLAWSSPFFGG